MKKKPWQQLCAFTALSVHAPCGLSACVHLVLAHELIMGICVRRDMEVQV